MRLETSRLFIRRLNESDWQEMQKVFIDFNNSKYTIYDIPLPTEKYDSEYCFDSTYHSNGYAYESTDALVKCIATEYGATHFTTGTALDNKPSCKQLDKLGFVCISIENVSFDNTFSFQGCNSDLLERTI